MSVTFGPRELEIRAEIGAIAIMTSPDGAITSPTVIRPRSSPYPVASGS